MSSAPDENNAKFTPPFLNGDMLQLTCHSPATVATTEPVRHRDRGITSALPQFCRTEAIEHRRRDRGDQAKPAPRTSTDPAICAPNTIPEVPVEDTHHVQPKGDVSLLGNMTCRAVDVPPNARFGDAHTSLG